MTDGVGEKDMADTILDRLEEYTGLTARPVIMMQIFDGDDYVGNTHNDLLRDILRKAGIEVVEDGKQWAHDFRKQAGNEAGEAVS